MLGRQFTCVFAVLLMVTSADVHAGYLRLVPSVDVQVDESRKVVQLKWNVLSEGNEMTKDVELDLPQLNERHFLSKELAPGASLSHSMTVPFEKLRILERGAYSLIYRVLYKDTNSYPFSAPYVAQVLLPPSPSRALVIELPDLDSPEDPLRLSATASTELSIQNPLSEDVRIDAIEPLAPVEVTARLTAVAPWSLKSQEKRSTRIDLARSGALAGSTYVLGVVVSGVAGGKHFSEIAHFVVEIRESRIHGRQLLGFALVALSLSILSAWAFQRFGGRKFS